MALLGQRGELTAENCFLRGWLVVLANNAHGEGTAKSCAASIPKKLQFLCNFCCKQESKNDLKKKGLAG